MSKETVKKWYINRLSQVQLTEYGFPNPINGGIGDGEKIKQAREERRKGSLMANEKSNQTEQKNRPEKKFRFGCVTATIWKNELDIKGVKFDQRSVNIEKSYKDNEGNWKNTNSLKTQDVPKAMLALQKAYEFMVSSHNETEE